MRRQGSGDPVEAAMTASPAPFAAMTPIAVMTPIIVISNEVRDLLSIPS